MLGCQVLLVDSSTTRRKKTFSLSLFEPENLVSRDRLGRPVPRRPRLFSTPRLNFVLAHGILSSLPPSATEPIHRVSSEFFRSCNCVPMVSICRESAGTGPMVLKRYFEVTGATYVVFRYIELYISPWTTTNNNVCVCVCVYLCVCVCVFSSHPFWTSSSLDVPAGVTQEEGRTGFLIHLLSAVRALTFLARRIQPFLFLVDCEVEFCVLTI